MLDKDMAIRLGRPPIINDDDVDIPLPERGDYFESTGTEGDKLDAFYHHVMLSRIESKIYEDLYSVRSQRGTVGNRLRAIARLDKELQEWRDDLPPTLRPDQPLSCTPDQTAQVIMLHFVYYNCMTTIHRSPAHCALWTMGSSTRPGIDRLDNETHHRLYTSQLHCINAARGTAHLLDYLVEQDRLPQDVLIR